MAKVKFTAGRVDEHSCPAGKSQAFIWDNKASGLGLRVTANNVKAYVFQCKVHGQTVRVTIGAPKDWPIDKAQGEARRLQRLVDEGKDPREVKADERAAHEARRVEARRQDATFGEAWDAYVLARRTKWSERHYRDHVKLACEGRPRKRGDGMTMAGPLASLRPLKLPELTGERVAQWLGTHTTERPSQAALAYRMLRAFIIWGAETPEYRGVIPTDSYKTRSVRDAVPRSAARQDAVLQRDMLRSWFAAMLSIGTPTVRVYLQALLITGARPNEILGLKWTDVDSQWGALSISDKIKDEGRVIPLTPYLSSQLAELPRRNQFVFGSMKTASGTISMPTGAHTKAIAAAGLPHIQIYGLRKSFATLSEWVECPDGVAKQIMGHAPGNITEKHYIRRPLDLLRMWHEKIEAWMLQQAGIEFDADQATGLRAVAGAAA